MRITRRYKFNAQRIQDRHRYTVEVTFEGLELGTAPKIMNFSEADRLVNEVLKKWNNAVVVNKYSTVDNAEILEYAEKYGVQVVECNMEPTAEHMASCLFSEIEGVMPCGAQRSYKLYRVRLFPSADCWVDKYHPQSFK